ncbi:MAG TPA: TonB-dependent receptor [Cytophagales bacterium]|nr:TonB-dependent receptor [Cytophagales bacterium]
MLKNFSFLLLLLSNTLFAQNYSQTIKGRVVDKELKHALIGATVAIINEDGSIHKGQVTDIEGFYKIENIQVGRITVRFSMLGYKEITIPDISIHTGKEVVLNIEMQEAPEQLGEVVITSREKGRVNNEMAAVSARSFDISETKRYPASRDDIGRMVSNFAGVRGADDSRNDIVIRGNSPSGVLWRLEGINIPNPNHFAVFGTTGGPVSVLNNKTLGNSDFFTGAFPAEYGNATAGVFDVRMRNGNNENREHTIQLGFLGVEAVTEGPISKKSRSSYLVSYRYSTLGLMKKIGLSFGASGIPQYQDYSFKLNFPLKNEANLSVFSVGGKSDIALLDSERDSSEWTFGRSGRDIHFGSKMGAIGVNYQKSLNATTFAKLSFAASGNTMYSRYDTLDENTQKKGAQYRNDFKQGKVSLVGVINKKITSSIYSKVGIIAEQLYFDFIDSTYSKRLRDFQVETIYQGSAFLVQPYIQFKVNLSSSLILNTGLHYQHFFLNENSTSLEPRIGLKWALSPTKSISFGTGLHSQLQPSYIYFQTDTSSNSLQNHNKDVGFTKSLHVVAGYDQTIAENFRLKTEVYYQHLYNIPVEEAPSAFSTVNQGGGFTFIRPGKLTNKGTGTNYGLELTLEKFFNQGYYFLLTGSLYESFYKGSDGIRRRSEFNGNYAANALGGYELKMGKSQNTVLAIGGKFTIAGGRRFTPIDPEESKAEGEAVYIDSLSYSKQYKPYWRTDIRVSIRKSHKKFSHELSLDLINSFNTRNILTQTYDARNNRVILEYQLGFLPLLNYIIDL